MGFVATEMTFDKSVVKLAKDIDISPSPLKKKINVTSVNDANNTGKISIVLGLEPSDISSPANGTFRIANIKLEPNSDLKNLSSKFSFIQQNTQVVGMDESAYTITATNGDVKINESSETTPSPIPQAITPSEAPTQEKSTISNLLNRKKGDVDKNGVVNILDIGRVVNTYDGDANTHLDEDVNGDGKINVLDLGVISDNYE